MTQLRLSLIAITAACTPQTNDIVVRLAPDVVSSLDGTLAVQATVLGDRQPIENASVDIAVDYTDRNGTAHMITPASGVTDKKGMFAATLTGLTWDGTGTVKATVAGTPIEADATFAVLDRTPPKVTIVPPAMSQVHRGMTTTIQVHVADEIGVSQVLFDTNDQFNGNNRSGSLITTGATDVMVGFDFQTDAAIGSTINLYALGADLSGNQAAATPIQVMVVQ